MTEPNRGDSGLRPLAAGHAVPASRRPFALLPGAALLGLALAMAAPAARADDGDDLFERDTLTGDWGGLRSHLISHGVTLGLRYTGEVFSNVSGGLRTGTVYENQFLLTGDFDFDRMAGLSGLTGHVSGISLQGRGPAFNLTGSAADPSNVEYLGRNQRYTRLWTAWLQQNLADDVVSLRVGQLSTDDEFMVSPTAGNLMNSTFGWNVMSAANLPAGLPNSQDLTNGAGYPLGAPGVRLQVAPNENWAWLTAALSHQPESVDRGGAQFKIRDAFVISELQYLRNQGKDATGLPFMIKLGGWYDTGKFDEMAKDSSGNPLLPDETPGSKRGESTIYGVVDSTLWRSEDGSQAVSAFMRGQVAPDDDINTVGLYFDGGVSLKGPLPGREADVVTLGAAWAQATSAARTADRLAGVPPRNSETAIELSYIAAVAPWWTVQPDFQYIIHPGFGALNPLPSATPGSRIDDAAVLAVRTTINF